MFLKIYERFLHDIFIKTHLPDFPKIPISLSKILQF